MSVMGFELMPCSALIRVTTKDTGALSRDRNTGLVMTCERTVLMTCESLLTVAASTGTLTFEYLRNMSLETEIL